MQQTHKPDSSSSEKKSQTAVEEPLQKTARSRAAVEEARQMLDEIAGVNPQKRRANQHRDTAKIARAILLLPITLIMALIKLLLTPFTKADFKLAKEMRQFLAHPGHFFWFNRLAPQAAQQQFGTTSTETMTQHARRYGSHLAMLILAVVVVVGGGFSGLAREIFSPDAYAGPHGQTDSGYLITTDDMHEVYLNSIGTSSTLAPKRIKVYEAKQGDTLRSIAAANNISLDTLLFANLVDDPDKEIKAGDKLVVPPVTGMLHIASATDTVGKIAETYQVDPTVILDYAPNNLKGFGISTPLKNGMEIMAPGGVRPPRDKIIIYKVRPGDTLKSVADKFGITPETIAIFEDLADNAKLTPGQELRILPISGIQIRVQKGWTLQQIASFYSVPVENIVNYPPNNVGLNSVLQPGQTLFVPNGKVPPPPPPPPAPVTSSGTGSSSGTTKPAPIQNVITRIVPPPPPTTRANPSSGVVTAPKPAAPAASSSSSSSSTTSRTNSASRPAAVTTGSMVWPVRGVITTYFGQYIWYGIHMGLDISGPVNTPIVAADGGIVVSAGWDGGYGLAVTIAHSNGLYTLYGHMNALYVSAGQAVYRGQQIGIEGSTGNSTGPHLHFEVRTSNVYGRVVNPLAYLP